jgi:hypothetical protein
MGPIENVKDSQTQISLIGLRVHRMSMFSSAKKVESDGISSRSIEAESKKSGSDVLEEKVESNVEPTGGEPNPLS